MRQLIVHIFFLICISSAFCQDLSLLQEIKQDSALDLYLTLDWRKIEKTKKDKAYESAQVRLITSDPDTFSMTAKVRTRGHMRLNICSFPPLKLKLDKNELEKYDLSAFNELDIVHHCHADDSYQQYLLREYLAYKFWELVSPYYFKVQLLRLHYQNEDGSRAYQPSYAFFVEHTEELVDRLGARRNSTPVISDNAVEKEPMLLVTLFEFMIGNTDWFILNRHNLEFVAIPGHKVLVPIPYDFDYSGLVSAPYAAHHESLNLSSVVVRYYQGWCHTDEEIHNALKVFHEQKEKILALPSQIQGLSERSIQYANDYLQDFFEIIENPKKLEHQVIRHCDMWPVKD